MQALARFIASYVTLVIRYPKSLLAVFAILTLASLFYLKNLSFDSSAESFLHLDDPKRLEYLQFEDKYGLSAYLIVLIRDEQLFTAASIERLRALHQALEEGVPHLNKAESLINARFVYSEEDDIFIEPLIGEGTLSLAELENKKQAVLQTPYFINRLVNQQANATAIVLHLSQYDDKAERAVNMAKHINQSISAAKSIIAQQQANFAHPILLGGSPVIGVELTNLTQKEMVVFFLMATLTVAIALWLIFKRLTAVIFPLLFLFATIVWTLATMVLFDFAIQVSSIILPSFLMAVGVADAVHFLRAYYASLQQLNNVKAAIHAATEHTGVAIFFTTLTTSVGLLSFVNSNVASIANFGIFAALGVWIALLIIMTCLPAVLFLLPQKTKAANVKMGEAKHYQWLQHYVDWLSNHSKAILIASSSVLLLSLFLASQLSFSLNILEWFKKDYPIRQTTEMIEQQMASTMQLEVLVSRHDKQSLQRDDFLRVDTWLQAIINDSIEDVVVSADTSIINLLKETNRVLSSDQAYQLADSQALLAQQLLLLQLGVDDLDSLTTKNFDEIRISLATPWLDSYQYDRFIEQIQQRFVQQVGTEYQMIATGMASLTNKAFKDQVNSMIISYVYAGVVILLLIMLLARSVKLGTAIMLLPNITPIAMLLACMYVFNIPLDIFTILIGSIAIGLIVDDTIHILHTFQRFHAQMGDAKNAMLNSLQTTGNALVVTSVVLCLAFMVYGFSSLNNLVAFGYLTALCVLLALLSDLLVLPAMLLFLYNKNK